MKQCLEQAESKAQSSPESGVKNQCVKSKDQEPKTIIKITLEVRIQGVQNIRGIWTGTRAADGDKAGSRSEDVGQNKLRENA